MVQHHYESFVETIATQVVCYHCLKAHGFDAEPTKLGLIELRMCSEAFQFGQRQMSCPIDTSAAFPLEHVAPDICLLHLPVRADIELAGQGLGEGAFGQVLLGTIRGTDDQVAVKTLIGESAQVSITQFLVFGVVNSRIPSVPRLEERSLCHVQIEPSSTPICL